MIKSLLITGIISALSIFGIKTGLGMAPLVYDRSIPVRKKLLFLAGILLVYFLLFFGLYALTVRFQLLNYLDHFLEIMRYGILPHLFVASGLILWGIKLLLSAGSGSSGNSRNGILLLILPCPVCAMVILLTLSLAYSTFSISLVSTTMLLFGIFSTIAFLVVLILFPFRRQIDKTNSSFLGLVMIMVSTYFFLTLLIAPVYQEIQDVYGLASQNAGNTTFNLKSFLILMLTAVILFSAGYFIHHRKSNLLSEE